MDVEPNKCSRISSDHLERPEKGQGATSDGSAVASGRRPARRDGFSLVEMVITIALLGTVVVGVLAAVQGSIKASTTARHSAQIQTVLLNAADRVNRAPKGCGSVIDGDYESHYRPFVMAAVALQWGQDYSGEVTVHERHYVPPQALPGNPNLDTSGTWADGACSATSNNPSRCNSCPSRSRPPTTNSAEPLRW